MLNKKNNNNLLPLLLFVGMFFCAPSCKKDTGTTPDVGYSYFPNTVGRYVVYDVDSVVYDDFLQDTLYYKFRIKEKAESVYADNSGRPTIRLERYRKMYDANKSYDSIPWTLKDIWAENRTATAAEKVEENIRYVKLIFPVEKGATWNGNSFNTFSEWKYKYTTVDKPAVYGNLNFDSTVFVTQTDYQDLIQKKYYVEVYARNVGMIYKEAFDVYSDVIKPGIPVEDRIKAGTHTKMTVVSYGTE